MTGSSSQTPQDEALTVAVVGVGLIGGSLALALRESGFAARVVGCDKEAGALDAALRAGIIDERSTLAGAVEAADLLVLAVPVRAAMELLDATLDHVASGAGDPVITDVASVKGALLDRVAATRGSIPPRLIPGHPIAGGERSGVGAANGALFRHHRVILTPAGNADTTALALVERMWHSTGATVERLEAEEHDRILAFTSHLPHFLAYALVDTLARDDASENIFRFAAGGFRDFTRIASSNPVMWRDIALTNREALLAAIDAFEGTLASLRGAVEGGEGAHLESVFRRARDARDSHIAGTSGGQGGG